MSEARITARAAGLAALFLMPLGAAAVEEMDPAAFLSAYKSSVAGNASGCFVRLADEEVSRRFESLLEAVLAGDAAAADEEAEGLEAAGVRYRVVRLVGTAGPVLGFMEAVRPGDPDYRGWGAVLARPGPAGRVVYGAPHPKADLYSEEIAFQAFLANPLALAAVLAGAHRNAVGDGDGDGAPDSDAANDTENLFHAVTRRLARRGLDRGEPLWFLQFHGAADRDAEPSVVGSDGSGAPFIRPGSPLAAIDSAVDDAGHITMGVCGLREGEGDDEDGAYALDASNNLQGAMLAALGQRHAFMHFEIERTARDEWRAGAGPGHDGIAGLLEAIASILASTGPSAPPPLPARISFQPAASEAPAGFLADTGSAFRFMDGPACGW
jgi:hypothetical protein